MAAVGLLFVGAVLFVNAVMLLGRVDLKSGGVFNLFVGGLQTLVPFYLIATAKSADEIFLASGIFLFGFTYLYLGITNLTGHPTKGLGWYCIWVSILALGYGLTNLLKFHDTKFGMIWFLWSFLWALFFLVLGLERQRLVRFTGWVTMIEAWITAAVPAFLILGGWWDRVSDTAAVVVAAATVVSFFLLAARTITPTPPVAGGPEATSGAAADLA